MPTEEKAARGKLAAGSDDDAGRVTITPDYTTPGPRLSMLGDLRTLARFFATPGPGEDPLDPASLGDPKPWGTWAVTVALLQRGMAPAKVAGLLTPEQLADLSAVALVDAPDLLTTARLAERWHLLGIDDLLIPPLPPDYVVSDMFRKPGLVCVYGAPGTLKSMLLAELGISVAAGLPWLSPLPTVGKGGSYTVTQSPVLWIDQDNGRNRMQERIGALCRARGVTDAPIYAVCMPRPLVDLGNDADTDLLVLQAQRLGAGMIVVDNLGTISGGRDENSSEMVSVMANLRWLAEAAQAGVFVIHHARKGSTQGGGRAGDNLRGHSSIEASLDLALYVERGEDDLTVKSTKTRDDPVNPFVARWTYEKDIHGALDTGRLWHVETVESDKPEYMSVAADLPDLVTEMDDTPNQSELIRATREAYSLGRNSASRAIRHAVSKGWLVEESDGDHRTARKRYSTPDALPLSHLPSGKAGKEEKPLL